MFGFGGSNEGESNRSRGNGESRPCEVSRAVVRGAAEQVGRMAVVGAVTLAVTGCPVTAFNNAASS